MLFIGKHPLFIVCVYVSLTFRRTEIRGYHADLAHPPELFTLFVIHIGLCDTIYAKYFSVGDTQVLYSGTLCQFPIKLNADLRLNPPRLGPFPSDCDVI